MNPVFVFGVSGATWDIIDPMLDRGLLPNIRKLRDGGCSATLRSCRARGDKHFRPQTAWPTIATGLPPEQHGISRFWHCANDQVAKNIWDCFLKQNIAVGLYGWPMTWPPKKIQGFVIPCHHARDSQTWPPELATIKKLDRWQQNRERSVKRNSLFNEILPAAGFLLRNGLTLTRTPNYIDIIVKLLFSKSAEERALLLRHAKLEISMDLFLHLYKSYQPGFVAFVTFLVDFASHRYWNYHQPEIFPGPTSKSTLKLKSAVEDAYSAVDRQLARVTAKLPSNATVAVLSEHGMGVEPNSAEAGEFRFVIRGTQLAQFVGLDDWLEACPVARWIAFRPKPGFSVPTDAARRFESVIVMETQLPLFQVYKHGDDEVIVKFNIDKNIPRYAAGDLGTLQVEYRGNVKTFDHLARAFGAPRSAMHTGEGVFLIMGPDIKSGRRIENASIIDIAPTLIKCATIDCQQSFAGKVLNIF